MKNLLSTIICLVIMCVASVTSATTVRPMVGDYAPDYFDYCEGPAPSGDSPGYYSIWTDTMEVDYNPNTGEIQLVLFMDPGYSTGGLTVGQPRPDGWPGMTELSQIQPIKKNGKTVANVLYYRVKELVNGRNVWLMCVVLNNNQDPLKWPVNALGYRYMIYR